MKLQHVIGHMTNHCISYRTIDCVFRTSYLNHLREHEKDLQNSHPQIQVKYERKRKHGFIFVSYFLQRNTLLLSFNTDVVTQKIAITDPMFQEN